MKLLSSVVLVLAAGSLMSGCENSAGGFRNAFGVGSGTARVGDQREMSSLSSLAVDLSQEFNLPRGGAGSPAYALQPSDSPTEDYFVIETFPRDTSLTMTDIRAQLKELLALSADLRGKQQQAAQGAKALAEAQERTLKIEEERTKGLAELTKAIRSVRPENAASLQLENLVPPSSTIDTPGAEVVKAQKDDANKALEAFKAKEAELARTLSKGNIIIVDWDQLGGGSLTGTIGPIGVSGKAESKANGIAILNGFRKIRKVSKNSGYDPKQPGNEPFGDNFERPRDATYVLQAQEVMYFALDGSEFSAGVSADPTKPSTGGWDVGGSIDVKRLQQYANFGILREPTVTRMPATDMTTEFSNKWVTVQVVGSPRYAMPRQQAPVGAR